MTMMSYIKELVRCFPELAGMPHIIAAVCKLLRRDDRARLLLASQPPRLYMPIIGFYQGQRAEYAIGWHDDRSGFGCHNKRKNYILWGRHMWSFEDERIFGIKDSQQLHKLLVLMRKRYKKRLGGRSYSVEELCQMLLEVV